MKIYVVYRHDKCGKEVYWTGGVSLKGRPTVSVYIGKALVFDDASEAYRIAGQRDALSRFKVGEREL